MSTTFITAMRRHFPIRITVRHQDGMTQIFAPDADQPLIATEAYNVIIEVTAVNSDGDMEYKIIHEDSGIVDGQIIAARSF